MALNRQKILSELGSVMNQLQSADCGCMGKLFGQPGQNTQHSQGDSFPAYGGCRRGACCGHGFSFNAGSPHGSEPCAGSGQSAPYHCMGHCNPPKLYADTYNYLNSNLMQPVVKEVYDDLRSITPANTVTNNPLANQMGLSPTQGNVGDKTGLNMVQSPGNPGQIPQNAGQHMNTMHGMGPQIMNILGSNMNAKPNYMEGQGGKYGETMNMNAQQAISNNSNVMHNPIQENNLGDQVQNINQLSLQNSPYLGSNACNMIPSGQQPTNMNASPAEQQMSAPPHHNHGLHSQGIAKFKEMFPGVMQGVDGDLGFDPMSIAIQMNPANQQQAAMDAMQKIMNNNTGLNKSFSKAGSGGVAQPGSNQVSKSPNPNLQQNILGNLPSNESHQREIAQQNVAINQQTKMSTDINNNQSHQVNQQIYPAMAAATAMNQQQQPIPSQYQEQTVVDPKSATGVSPNLPTIYEGMSQNPTSQVQRGDILKPESMAPQQMIKDPIFPADNTRYHTYAPAKQQKFYEYNTLGQPIEAIPAKMYHTLEPDLPQTLSPQPVPFKLPAAYNNVKSTISKTSLVQNRAIGKTPSRGQLQQIYNQYKGSQSFTQQNIRAPEGASRSDGRLYVPQNITSVPNTAPIEKTGGDSVANNEMRSLPVREQVMGQIGDVPLNNKPAPMATEKVTPLNDGRGRNGLQDMVYTSYPTSTAWTFHGHGREAYSAGYGYRNRV